MIQKFRKKPEEIEAMQWTNEPGNFTAIKEWAGDKVNSASPLIWKDEDNVSMCLEVKILMGITLVRLGDWIVKDIYGVFSCTTETLHRKYEPIN